MRREQSAASIFENPVPVAQSDKHVSVMEALQEIQELKAGSGRDLPWAVVC